MVAELNKFGVTGPLHFYKEILPCQVAEFVFQKLQYVWNGKFYL